MFRFLLLVLPLVALTIAVADFALDAFGVVRPPDPPGVYLLGGWLLEATGLVALFVLVRERGLNRWLAGLAGSWAAWIFRGPVLAVSVAGVGSLGRVSWGNLILAWLGVYTACGLLIAALAPVARGAEVVAAAAPVAEEGG